MIVSGGFNVCPRDVEDVIGSHPAVAMVAVTAMVLLKPGATVDAELLVAMVRDKMGRLMAPKHIEFITEMPRTAVGQIDKKVQRAPFWAGQGRQVG